ncbi:hypothetical protein SAMN04487912_12213 [Arthrobacter sp. cf158]|uniref:hypothetical protein n=1 Tax=Arthrobacter sp. cf158 TaxID=1761744 RepID=UPI00089AFB73|nr:hypothetical protein [Arthrobacter sp. cf158]SDX60848.1 hypothetical protein SAMN04487912_12213 [Arthrobacter sp. cf158]
MNKQTAASRRGSRAPRARLPVQDWDSLQHGIRVEVHAEDAFPYVAYVDRRDIVGGVIWLIEDGTGMRRLFLRNDPVALYLEPGDHD